MARHCCDFSWKDAVLKWSKDSPGTLVTRSAKFSEFNKGLIFLTGAHCTVWPRQKLANPAAERGRGWHPCLALSLARLYIILISEWVSREWHQEQRLSFNFLCWFLIKFVKIIRSLLGYEPTSLLAQTWRAMAAPMRLNRPARDLNLRSPVPNERVTARPTGRF